MFKIFAITSLLCELYGLFTKRQVTYLFLGRDSETNWVYSGGKSNLYMIFSMIEAVFSCYLVISRYWYLGFFLVALGILSFKWPRSVFYYYFNRLLSMLLLLAYIIIA